MSTIEAEVAFYFHLTIGALIVVMASVVVLIFVLSYRAHKKVDAQLARILSLPQEKVQVWVSSFEAEYEEGTHTEYTLYFRVENGPAEKMSGNDTLMKYAYRQLAAAKRPVQNTPEWLRQS